MAGESNVVEDPNGPKDPYHIVSFLALLCGLAVLFVSSALIINADYYVDVFGEKDGEQLLFLISLSIALSSPFVQLGVANYANNLTYTSRIITCFGLNAVLAVCFPLVLTLSPDISFYLALLIAFIVGVNNGILKVTTFALFASFPARFSHLIVLGKGISPLIVILLKIMVKTIGDRAAETGTAEERSQTIKTASTIFFFIAASVPIIGCIVYRIARKTIFSKHYISNFKTRKMLRSAKISHDANPDDVHPDMVRLTENPEQYDALVVAEGDCEDSVQQQQQEESGDATTATAATMTDPLQVGSVSGYDYHKLSDDTDVSSPTSPGGAEDPAARVETKTIQAAAEVNKWVVMKKLSLPLSLMIISFFTTFSVYPSVINKTKSTIPSMTNSWYHIWTLLVFAISDLGARSLPYEWALKLCSVQRVDLLVYCRLFFVPIFYYAAYIEQFANQIIWLLTIILASTTGLVFVLIIRNYQHMVSEGERPVAGSFMSIAIVVGVALGNVLAVCVEKFIQ